MQLEIAKILPPEDPLRASIDDLAIMELAQSMAQLGQLQPVGVTVNPDNMDQFQLIYGHRRWLAARSLNWTHIEAVHVTATNHLQASRLVENTQRTNLTDIEEAHALQQLITDTQCDEPTAARLTGKSKAWVRSRLSMLDWPEELQAAVHEDLISQGVARHLARIPDSAIMLDYLSHAINSGCTTATAAIWANGAILAAQGIAAASAHEHIEPGQSATPQIVEQFYNCYICAERKSFRQVNLMVLCSSCQETLATERLTANAAPR